MSFIDVVILISVILIVGLILFFNIRNKIKGKSECSSCPFQKKCNKCDKNDKNNKNNKSDIN